jgi:acyl carrier protein phosphodiesterase
MNILAHALLSNKDEEIIVGNIITDFIKGNKINGVSEGIQKGVVIHREIDRFSDNHIVVKEVWKTLNPEFGHYARVVSDIYFDYFLSQNWSHFSTYSIDEYTQFAYNALNTKKSELPRYIRRIINRIIAYDWFKQYQTVHGLGHVFRGLSRRAEFQNKFENASIYMQENQAYLNQKFLCFFPELQEHINRFIDEINNTDI